MIQKEICSYYNLEMSELVSKKRNKQVVFPRQVAMFLCRKITDASFPQIGDQFGGRDHTTVIHAVEKIEKEVNDNSELAATLDELSQRLNSNHLHSEQL